MNSAGLLKRVKHVNEKCQEEKKSHSPFGVWFIELLQARTIHTIESVMHLMMDQKAIQNE